MPTDGIFRAVGSDAMVWTIGGQMYAILRGKDQKCRDVYKALQADENTAGRMNGCVIDRLLRYENGSDLFILSVLNNKYVAGFQLGEPFNRIVSVSAANVRNLRRVAEVYKKNGSEEKEIITHSGGFRSFD